MFEENEPIEEGRIQIILHFQSCNEQRCDVNEILKKYEAMC